MDRETVGKIIAVAAIAFLIALAVLDALAAEPPTEPGEYRLDVRVDTTYVRFQALGLIQNWKGQQLYERHIDTVYEWTRLDEALEDSVSLISAGLIDDWFWERCDTSRVDTAHWLIWDALPPTRVVKDTTLTEPACTLGWGCTAPKVMTLEYHPCPGCGR